MNWFHLVFDLWFLGLKEVGMLPQAKKRLRPDSDSFVRI